MEVFEQIINCLSRKDVENMRLVNHEGESKVSAYLFRSVVVPFDTEIYDLLAATPHPKSRFNPNTLSKRREDATNAKNESRSSHVLKKADSGKYEGTDEQVDMFGGFGPHIRDFGMSFDIREASLAKPPPKSIQDDYGSFWGDFLWPSKEYRRFADRAGLEVTADETTKMIEAFSKLKKRHQSCSFA